MFTKNSEIDIENNLRRFKSKKPTIVDKRIMIKERLDKNFPSMTVLYYAHVFIGIGLTAIGLQIALIANKAVLYRMGNGIWGGCFAIINGLIKLYLCNDSHHGSYSQLFSNSNLFYSPGKKLLCVCVLSNYDIFGGHWYVHWSRRVYRGVLGTIPV